MSSSPTRLTAATAAAVSLLALQALSAPLVLVGLSQPSEATPRWVTGVYVALEVAALLTGAIVAWGLRAKRAAAHWAPAAVLLPCWLATAAVGPLVYGGVAVALFVIFAIAMGLLSSVPFLTQRGRALFTAA